jgi:hypothetical protein
MSAYVVKAPKYLIIGDFADSAASLVARLKGKEEELRQTASHPHHIA